MSHSNHDSKHETNGRTDRIKWVRHRRCPANLANQMSASSAWGGMLCLTVCNEQKHKPNVIFELEHTSRALAALIGLDLREL